MRLSFVTECLSNKAHPHMVKLQWMGSSSAASALLVEALVAWEQLSSECLMD